MSVTDFVIYVFLLSIYVFVNTIFKNVFMYMNLKLVVVLLRDLIVQKNTLKTTLKPVGCYTLIFTYGQKL